MDMELPRHNHPKNPDINIHAKQDTICGRDILPLHSEILKKTSRNVNKRNDQMYI